MAWRRGQAYGQDLRDRVPAARDLTLRQAAERFGVSSSYVSKVRVRLRELGDAELGAQRNHVPPRLAPLADALRAQVAAQADASLTELRAWVSAGHGVAVSHHMAKHAVPRSDVGWPV